MEAQDDYFVNTFTPLYKMLSMLNALSKNKIYIINKWADSLETEINNYKYIFQHMNRY